MANMKERKRVIICGEYETKGTRYLMTEEQIQAIHRMIQDGYIDDCVTVTVIDDNETWEIV